MIAVKQFTHNLLMHSQMHDTLCVTAVKYNKGMFAKHKKTL